LIVEALQNSTKPMHRKDVLAYVVHNLGVFSIKPHSFAAALSNLKKEGKIMRVEGKGETTKLWGFWMIKISK